MPKFMIEREMPGAGDFTDQEMRAISGRSCEVLSEMPQVQWIEGFVTVRLETLTFMDAALALYRDVGFRDAAPFPESEAAGTPLEPLTVFLTLDLAGAGSGR